MPDLFLTPWVKDTMSWWNARVGPGARQAKFIKKPSDSEDDSDQENDIAEIKAQCLAWRDIAPPQNKARSDVRRPAAAALFDDDESDRPPVAKTSTAPLPRPVKPKPRPQPQLVAQESSDNDPVLEVPPSTRPTSKTIRTDLPRPPIEPTDDIDEHSPPLARPAKKKPTVRSTECHQRVLESDEEDRALSPFPPPAKKTQFRSQTTKRPRPIFTDDDEERAPSPSPHPVKKIRSDSPLPPLTEDEDDEPSPLSLPKPTKQAKKVAPCTAVPPSPQPAAKKVSLKLKHPPATPFNEDEKISPDTPVAPKKKGKKTSTEATKRNPPRSKKRTNSF